MTPKKLLILAVTVVVILFGRVDGEEIWTSLQKRRRYVRRFRSHRTGRCGKRHEYV